MADPKGNTQLDDKRTPEQIEAERVAAASAATDTKRARAALNTLDSTASPHDQAVAAISSDERAKFERGELGDVYRESQKDDAKWKSTPGAQTMDFLVRCKIKGEVQGRNLIPGTIAKLELTADISHLVRQGVLEAMGGNLGRS